MDLTLYKLFADYGAYVFFGAIAGWLIIDSRVQSNKLVEALSGKLDEVRLAVGRRTLNPQETLDTVREKVWFASIAKLEFIKATLIENHLTERPGQITGNIRAKLEELSAAYIEEFNTYNTPITKLGDTVAETFEFESFFAEVMAIVFRKPIDGMEKDYLNELKMKDIEGVMRKYQNKMANKLSKIMSSKCNNCFKNVK